MIATILVEDNTMILHYLLSILERYDHFKVVATFRDAFEAEKACREAQVDLVLMDVATLHNHSGLTAGERIRRQNHPPNVVIVTSLSDPDILAKARAGAADSLWYKDHDEKELMEVIEKTLDGEQIFPDSSPSVELKDMFSEDITPRQLNILRCFVKGMTYSEIAEELNLTSRGVRWNIDEVVHKGGFANKHELLAALLNNKLIVTTLMDE